ncbi:MAG: proton-conducting transporter membrane subunit, partial [Methylocella sp.]
AGIPPLAGFFAKWYVFNAAIQAQLYPLAVIAVLSSAVAAFYYLRIVKVMYFDEPAPAFDRPAPALRIVLGVCGILVVFLFAYPGLFIDATTAAAKSLS